MSGVLPKDGKYALWNLMANRFVRPPRIVLSVTEKVRIEIRDIDLEFDHFDFSIDRREFPKVKDTGKASVSCGCWMFIEFQMGMDENKKLQVQHFDADITIETLPMAIVKCNHKQVFKTLMKMFQKKGKEGLQTEFRTKIKANLAVIHTKVGELFEKYGGKDKVSKLKQEAKDGTLGDDDSDDDDDLDAATRLFRQIDTDSSGLISVLQLLKWRKSVVQAGGTGISDEVLDACRAAYAKFECGNGGIVLEKFRLLLDELALLAHVEEEETKRKEAKAAKKAEAAVQAVADAKEEEDDDDEDDYTSSEESDDDDELEDGEYRRLVVDVGYGSTKYGLAGKHTAPKSLRNTQDDEDGEYQHAITRNKLDSMAVRTDQTTN